MREVLVLPILSSKAEAQPYSQFRIASISKLVTAIGIMKLKEEGLLSLNDSVFGPGES